MPSLLIRDIPANVYRRIKERAANHRRSLSKEALVMLEHDLDLFQPPKLDWSKFPTVKLLKPLDMTPEWIDEATNEGQE